jgi:hypothetical protein
MKLMHLLSTAAVLLATALPSAAHAATTLTPPGGGLLAVKAMAAKDVRIVQTSARQAGEHIIVGGHLQRKKVHGRVIPKGHVDIAIIDQEGQTIHQTAAQVSPTIIPRSHGVKASFMAEIPVLLPLGGHVRVKFHNGPHES